MFSRFVALSVSLTQRSITVAAGREVLAQLITRFEANLTAAVKDRDRQAADTAAATLMEAYKDLDDLLECKQAASCKLRFGPRCSDRVSSNDRCEQAITASFSGLG